MKATCPGCHGAVRTARDATGAPEMRYCVTCGDRSYVNADGKWSPYASDTLWRQRFLTRRYVDAWIKGDAERSGRPVKSSRAAVMAALAPLFADHRVPHWHTWSATACDTITRVAIVRVTQVADAIVSGPERFGLHVARAKQSRWPRAMMAWLLFRDRARVALARWTTRARLTDGVD